MKKLIVIFTLLLITVAGYSQATKKNHFEVPTSSAAFGQTISQGSLVLQTDSLYLIRIDSTFDSNDSLKLVYARGKWSAVNTRPYLFTGADSTGSGYPVGTIHVTKWNVFYKRNTAWVKLN